MRSTAAPAAQAPQQKKAKALQSDVIPKAKLVSVETVMEKYPKLKTIGNSGALAVKLARESVFGEEVLVQCTVFGARDLPDLPTEELGQLKQALFAQFPQFWGTLCILSLSGGNVLTVSISAARDCAEQLNQSPMASEHKATEL